MTLLLAWEWLKKNWMWLLFPLGIIIYFWGRLSVDREPPTVVSPELQQAGEKAEKVKEELDKKIAEAGAEKQEKLKKLKVDHQEKIEKLTDEQADEVERLLDDPDALNTYLYEVGRSVRSDV